MLEVKSLNRCLLVGIAGLALSACGGSGGSTSSGSASSGSTSGSNTGSSQPASTLVSGVAATGSPLAGTVTVKDANGTSKTVAIGANGSYTVDVSGMTAPFVLRAEGTANGHTYVIHSAAAAADVGGTINITQLTDLVVDNIAGQLASNYFDSGNFSALSTAVLDAEAAKLKERLLPVLQALGVDSSIDLLRSQFTPLASALDSALDIIRVSVDGTSHLATITNIVTQQQIQDDIAVPAASESSPAQLTDTTNLTSAVSDVEQIKTALVSFSAKFAGSLPSAESIAASLTTGFFHDDSDGASFAADLAADSSLVGASFTDVDIKNIDYSDLTQITANADFTVKDKNGIEMDRQKNFKIRKGTDGVWRLHGNRRVLVVEGRAQTVRSHGNADCTLTGLEFKIEDLDSANNGGTIDHIAIFGAGLPAEGLRYDAPAAGGVWPVHGQSTPYYVMGNSCVASQAVSDSTIAAVPDNAFYAVVAYASTDNSVRIDFPSGAIQRAGEFANGAYWLNIQKRPLTLAEAVASTAFPNITSPDSPATFSSYTSGALTITASGMNPNFYATAILEQDTVGGDFRETDAYISPNSDGNLSTSLSLTAAADGDGITWRDLRVATNDVYRRTMMTTYDLGTMP
jgi:hypothetical protein